MKRNIRRTLAALLAAGLLCALLSGCRKPVEHSTTVFAMDTVMNLTLYGDGSQKKGDEVLSGCVERLYRHEKDLSATAQDSIVSQINSAGGQPVDLGTDTAALLRKSLELCRLTRGALDITARPASLAWGFTTGEYRIPDREELAKLAEQIDYTQIALAQENPSGHPVENVTLPAGMALDLGAVAKGWAGDDLRSYLHSYGIQSALLDLGQSSIMAVGAKPDGSPWRVGIQDPAGDSYLGVLELNDQAMGTSGSYQRYFEEGGVRYCHIIDPDTAAPAQSGLASVTVVSDSCLVCDGLSTALFIMGLEEALLFWDSLRADPQLAFEAIFIEEDGAITVTAGLEDSFTLANGYTDREVTVVP